MPVPFSGYPYQTGNYSQAYQPMSGQQAYPQLPQMQSPMQSGLVCRLVGSREEAAQTQIPFDGNPYMFFNQMAGEAYMKQFNTLTGNTEFTTFTKSAPEKAAPFATKEDIEALRAEIEKMKKPGKKREVTEDE